MPWLRRPGESAQAYQAAKLYFELRAERSQEQAAYRLKKNITNCERWSVKFDWVKRAEAYDAWMDAKEQEAAEAFASQEREKWEQRERDRRERKFIQSEQLLEAGELMLRYPLTEVKRTVVVDESGRETQTQVIKPARWNKRDAVRYLVTGHALGEQAIRNQAPSKTKKYDTFVDVPLEPAENEGKS